MMSTNPRHCLFALVLLFAWVSNGFVNLKQSGNPFLCKLAARNMALNDEEWISLVSTEHDDCQSPVRKLVVEEGTADVLQKGSNVEIEYTGTLLGEKEWTAEDIVSCWLSELQGLDHLSEQFLAKGIDGSMLMDEARFTEEFCANELEIANKIQAKKLVMAAKRVTKQQQDHPAGTEFDSSIKRGKNFSFVLGGGKVIKAMDLAVNSMKVGERAKLVCRSDYAYGSEGLRSRQGDIIVPPFATLCFDLKLVSAD